MSGDGMGEAAPAAVERLWEPVGAVGPAGAGGRGGAEEKGPRLHAPAAGSGETLARAWWQPLSPLYERKRAPCVPRASGAPLRDQLSGTGGGKPLHTQIQRGQGHPPHPGASPLTRPCCGTRRVRRRVCRRTEGAGPGRADEGSPGSSGGPEGQASAGLRIASASRCWGP